MDDTKKSKQKTTIAVSHRTSAQINIIARQESIKTNSHPKTNEEIIQLLLENYNKSREQNATNN